MGIEGGGTKELVRLIPHYHEKTKLFLERCCLPHLAEAQAAPPALPCSASHNQSFTVSFFLLVDQVVNHARPARRGWGRQDNDCHSDQ